MQGCGAQIALDLHCTINAVCPCAGFVAGCWITYKKMDDLPEPAQVFLHAVMRRNQQGVPAIASTIPLSKHIAYKLDTW